MTPAVTTTPLIAPLENVYRPPRIASGTMAAGGVVAVLAGWALDGAPLGLGFLVLVLAFIGAVAFVGGREAWQGARGHRWLFAAAALLASFVVVRDSDMLVALDVLAAAWLLTLAVRGWNGDARVADATLGELVTSPFGTFGRGTWLGAQVTADHLRESKLAESATRLSGPAARVVFIAGPVVGLVTLLLAVGDASFRARLERLWGDDVSTLPLASVVRFAFIALCTAPIAAGLVSWAMRRRTHTPRAVAPLRVRLGAAESFALVGGLAVVTALFGAVSAECALAPDACVLPAGMTYAHYAHEGFYELVVAAGIVLAVLLSVPARAKLEAPGAVRALRATATALVATTLPMLVSAFARMTLYEDVYGFTRQRMLSQAICVFIATLLTWRAVTLWVAPTRFAVGAVVSAVACLAGLNVLNPDAFIVRHNLSSERQARMPPGQVVDVWYLAGLSADATPELIHFVQSDAPQASRESVAAAALQQSQADESPAPLARSAEKLPLSSFNLARWHERRLLATRPAGPAGSHGEQP